MKFTTYVVSIPENIVVNDILESNTSLSEYIQDVDDKEQFMYYIYHRILYNTVTKFTDAECKNSTLLFYLFIKYLKSTDFILGEIKTTVEDKIINISVKNLKEATRNYILQCGLLDCVLGGLK